MRLLPTLAIAFCAFGVMSMTESTANAQQAYTDGYGFGAGLAFGNRFDRPGNFGRYGYGFRGLADYGHVSVRQRLEEPPYFAKFPPVYYSHNVYRPYGVSPFAAPPGIVPVEMTIPNPVSINNPYFDHEVTPAAAPQPEQEKVADDDDVTWAPNPYQGPFVNR